MKTEEIVSKREQLNRSTSVRIEKISLSDSAPWHYDSDSGEIRNDSGSFFRITGIVEEKNGIITEQPIIIQNEIGYLGIIRKRINGEMMYLMQYKIEPGNVNQIQISPTIQATKSNFTRKHGGKAPAYLEYFVDSSKYKLVADQIQSEQSSRFLGKRNRNIIIELGEDDDIDVLPSHDWMSLKQIKELMKIDNLVNMDTRTVLSCIPFEFEEPDEYSDIFKDKALFDSVFIGSDENMIPQIYNYINNFKMFDEYKRHIVPLYSLKSWEMNDNAFVCKHPHNFSVIFCDIEIDGREVRHWKQPLFEASGMALFGLFTCVKDNVRQFLVKCRPETGCFDKMEIGPTVQREYISDETLSETDKLFFRKMNSEENILFDTILSEEGGRFYHEQNRNVIIDIDYRDVDVEEGYFWCDHKTLNMLVKVNNTLNIQLRNLISVLEF